MTKEKILGTAFIEAITLFVSITQSDKIYFEQFMDTLYNQPEWPQIEEICEWLHKHDVQAYATGEIDSTAPMSKFKAKRYAAKMNKYFYEHEILIPAETINNLYDSIPDRA